MNFLLIILSLLVLSTNALARKEMPQKKQIEGIDLLSPSNAIKENKADKAFFELMDRSENLRQDKIEKIAGLHEQRLVSLKTLSEALDGQDVSAGLNCMFVMKKKSDGLQVSLISGAIVHNVQFVERDDNEIISYFLNDGGLIIEAAMYDKSNITESRFLFKLNKFGQIESLPYLDLILNGEMVGSIKNNGEDCEAFRLEPVEKEPWLNFLMKQLKVK